MRGKVYIAVETDVTKREDMVTYNVQVGQINLFARDKKMLESSLLPAVANYEKYYQTKLKILEYIFSREVVREEAQDVTEN